ncbi:MAG: glutathionylspermidine synthase family protein [Tissierellaceae bacterium]|nr:glutathionylspermidine synthase family protein [Tissierellaceae bacterium]
MNIKEINKEYIDLVMNNQEVYYDDYKLTVEKVKHSSAQYKGKPVPFLYHPFFVNDDIVKDFKKISETMMSIGNKVTDRYVEDENFRKKFGFSNWVEELIQIDNGYDINVPIGRFDIFYGDSDNFKFCELNTDGSSAMNEDNTIGKILLETKALQEFGRNHKLNYFDLINTWVDTSIEIYNRYEPSNKNPNVAIVDFIESGTSAEFEVFKDAYEAKGYNCIIVDPRELEYRGNKLYFEDYNIDLVYRRIVTFELIEKADEIPDFIEAYKDQAFCCIGSIKSQVIHNKIFFKILHDEDTLEILSQEEREFVKKHIPYTGIFGGNEDVFQMVLNNKDKYIMKPMDLNASQGVYVGKDLSQEEWDTRLKKDFNNEYLYQEFVDSFTREYLVYNDDKFTVEDFGSVVGLFLYNEKFSGIYTRIGQKNIISGVTDYYAAPSILVD